MGFLDSLFNSAKSSIENGVNSAVKKTVHEAQRTAQNKASSAINKAMTQKKKSFTFGAIPTSLDELKALKEADMKDPSGVVALTILAFNALVENNEVGMQMLDFLNGPADICNKEKQFVNDRFMDGKEYVVKSYFKGATPTNNYTPNVPYVIEVGEQAHSKDIIGEGYLKLFVHSGGADSDRYMILRKKASTGQWFLWEYSSILASIRIPTEADKWA